MGEENNDIIEEIPKKKVNKSKIVIFVLSLLVLGLLSLCVYNNYLLKLEKEKNNTNNTNTTSESKGNKEEIKDNTTLEENKDLTFNGSNIENNKDDNYYLRAKGINGMYVAQRSDNTVEVNYTVIDSLKTYCPDINTTEDSMSKIIKFDNNIVDLYFMQASQGIGYESILFLLSDGTVEYMPLCDSIVNGIKSYGKITGLKNIVRFYEVSALPKEGEFGGYPTVLAKDKDNKLYDIYLLVKDNKYFQ